MNRLLVVALVTAMVLAVVPVAAQPSEAGGVAAPDRPLLISEVQTEPDFRRSRFLPRVIVLEPDGSVRRLVEGTADQASWSPDGERVAYHDFIDGGLRLVRRDGSEDRPLVADVIPAERPWSPDGTELLATGPGSVLAVDVATGSARDLVSAFGGALPAWSPDGSRVVYVDHDVPGGRLQVVPRAGGPPTALTTDLEIVGQPVWSPDGDQIAVAANPGPDADGTPGLPKVYLAQTDGSGTRLVASESVPIPTPRFSPDGTRLAFDSCQDPDCTSSVTVFADPLDPTPSATAVRPDVSGALAWTDDQTILVRVQAGGIAELDVTDATLTAVGPSLEIVQSVDVDPSAARPPLTATVARALGWSRQRPADSAPSVLLGRADDFADALASGGAQGALDAPLLLTPRERLDPAVLTELDRLGTQEVVLLGGAAAVSPVVEQALQDSGRTTSRLEGPTRIDTAVAVAEAVMPGARRILLARAFGDAADPTRGFADALAAGAAAASLGSPLLLTDTNGLSEALTDYLDRTASITSVVVFGGEAAIGTAVTDALAARGLDVTRVAGEERVATAAAVTRFTLEADAGDDSPTPTGGTYVVVDGTDPLAWADGFAAAGLTNATQGGGVLLVDPTVVAQPTAGVLAGAVDGSAVRCASLVHQRICNDAMGIHGTTQPEGAATARLAEGDVIADVVVQEAGETICILAAIEGADMAGFGIDYADPAAEPDLTAPGDDGRVVMCQRASFAGLRVEALVADGVEVVVTTTDGLQLRGDLARV